jgi:cysteine sulfinate desulfinase/cysteine desulfurase-like protein
MPVHHDVLGSAVTNKFRALLCCVCCSGCLQLSPAALLQLAEMGYSEREAQRALRFSGSDLAAAVDFLTEQRQREQVRHICAVLRC